MRHDGLSLATGVLPREQLARLSGVEFLVGLLRGTLPAPPFIRAADFWPVSCERGRVVFEAAPSVGFYNPMGIVHGGWIAMLLDTAMGCAVHSDLAPGHVYSTIELRTVFVKPVLEGSGILRCEGTLLHRGGRVAGAEGKVLDSNGTLIAYGAETCLVTEVKPRSP